MYLKETNTMFKPSQKDMKKMVLDVFLSSPLHFEVWFAEDFSKKILQLDALMHRKLYAHFHHLQFTNLRQVYRQMNVLVRNIWDRKRGKI